VDFREYGDNISRRWEVNEMHSSPTGNQARLLPNYIHHSWTATKDGGWYRFIGLTEVEMVRRTQISALWHHCTVQQDY